MTPDEQAQMQNLQAMLQQETQAKGTLAGVLIYLMKDRGRERIPIAELNAPNMNINIQPLMPDDGSSPKYVIVQVQNTAPQPDIQTAAKMPKPGTNVLPFKKP